MRALKHGELPLDPESLVIEVPLRFSATDLAKNVRKIVKHAMSQQSSHRKSRKKSSTVYALSAGTEPKYLAIRDMMVVYRDVQLPNRLGKKQLKGTPLLKAVNEHFLKRRKPHNKVPVTLQITYERDAKTESRTRDVDQAANLNALRSLNRYIHKAERIMMNVAKGEFPGRY